MRLSVGHMSRDRVIGSNPSRVRIFYCLQL